MIPLHPAPIPRPCTPDFPATRYQGSKRKLASGILSHLKSLDFRTVLDAFGGTGAVSHAFKCIGKCVTYNDVLRFNHMIGVALIENDVVMLDDADVSFLFRRHADVRYGSLIEETFEDVYFTHDENRWLDLVQANIRALSCRFKRAIAWYALFQSAMAKRPYNLFHRKNLYMRHAQVTRGFGNKKTWDKSFEAHFRTYVEQANDAIVDGNGSCRALCGDVFAVAGEFDLVYIDTPYITANGVGLDYRDFYHFLEGMMQYDDWPELIDRKSRHLRLQREYSPWTDPRSIHAMFEMLFDRFRKGILVVSYRSDGTPSIEELVTMLGRFKPHVAVVKGENYQYALSKNRSSREVLMIAS